jgi:hypothetical protein
MRLISFKVAGSGGRPVFVNPEHVVCLMDAGSNRTQIVTTGLSGETSISLVVDLDPAAVAAHLQAEG